MFYITILILFFIFFCIYFFKIKAKIVYFYNNVIVYLIVFRKYVPIAVVIYLYVNRRDIFYAILILELFIFICYFLYLHI